MGWPELIQGVHRKSVYNSNVAYKIMNKSITYNTVHTDTYCNFKTIINLLELNLLELNLLELNLLELH